MGDQSENNSESLKPVSGSRALSRRSSGLTRRLKELQPKVDALRKSDDTEVIFPGGELEWMIRKELDKPNGILTRGDLKKLTHFDPFNWPNRGYRVRTFGSLRP